jgi:polyhydroxybutyrate depolymerase
MLYRIGALAAALLLVLSAGVRADDGAGGLAERKWKVGGVEREGLVYAPAGAKEMAAPLVFVFHGHGGNARQAARGFHIHELWPEAVVVYMQGVPTVGRLTDPEGKKNGWGTSGADGERDLAFFDAALKSVREDYKIDDARVFCTGHSNGGAFTYYLWAERGDVFAAMAPSAAPASIGQFAKMKPKPVLHCAGEKDELVKFAWQEGTIERLKKLNHVTGEGEKIGERVTRYGSAEGDTPVVTYIHPGGHAMPQDESDAIVKFFKARARVTTNPS